MSDDKLNKDSVSAVEVIDDGTPDSDGTNQQQSDSQGPSKKRKSNRYLKFGIASAVVVVLAAVGFGMMVWHEQPEFCSTICHIEGDYVDNYMQEQGVAGTDKYGNEVANTNAMMAVLHRANQTTAKSEIVCVDCHVPNMMELAHDGVNFVSGNYTIPRDERAASELQSWDGNTSESFCSNDSCHVYLLGDDGELSYDKLESVMASEEFNPHEQHHENLSLECTDCHKGHRASTVVCTGCHEHEDIVLPEGWVTYDESLELLDTGYRA